MIFIVMSSYDDRAALFKVIYVLRSFSLNITRKVMDYSLFTRYILLFSGSYFNTYLGVRLTPLSGVTFWGYFNSKGGVNLTLFNPPASCSQELI